jgi:hypothetical protein
MTCATCDGSGITQEGVVTITCPECDCRDTDQINPPHYKKAGGEIDDYICDIIRDLPGIEAYRVSQIVKYISRYREKHLNPRTDLEKAKWHLNKLRNFVIAQAIQSELKGE